MKKIAFVYAIVCLLCTFRPVWAFSNDATRALFDAAASGTAEEIRRLIERGADVNARDPRGRTAFMIAAERNPDVEVLRVLPDTGKVDVNDAAVRNETPFPFFVLYSNPLGYAAAGTSNPEVITFLLGAGARVNSSDSHGHLPLHLAAGYSSHPEVVRRLLDAGADVALIRESPLTAALVHVPAHPEIVGMLLEAGCEIRPGDLKRAVENGASVDVLRRLQEHGLDIEAAPRRRSGRNSLIAAALRNKNASFDMVRFLAESGAAEGFEEPLRLFGKQDSSEAQERFVEALVLGDAEVRDARGENLLTHLVRGPFRIDAEKLLSLVLDAGLDVDARNARGETALMLAADRPKLVAFLAARGADVNARTPVSDGENGEQSALMRVAAAVAHGEGNPGTAKTLLDLGADVDLPDASGRTPLMVAAGSRIDVRASRTSAEQEKVALDLIGLLAERGAAIDAADGNGRTALMHAAAAGCRLVVVRKLLESGANADLRDRQGSSALMLALGAPAVDSDGLTALADATRDPASLRNGRDTALKLAVGGNPERVVPLAFVEKLLAREWTPEEKNEALVEAPSWSSLNVERIELLIRHGADLNARGAGGKNAAMKFLFLSRYGSDTGGLRRLIELGLDIEARDDEGNTLPILAGDPYIPLLLEAGVDVAAANARGRTCLHDARGPDTLRRLLDAGAAPDAVDADGRTPLFFAIDPESLSLLLARGADANRRAAGGETPLLSWFNKRGGLEGVRALLDAGAEVDGADEGGRTPLLLLVEREPDGGWAKSGEKVAFLLERGADPNRKRSDGATPLSVLVRRETGVWQPPADWGDDFISLKKAVEILLAHGADPDEPDLSGKTPRDYAAEHRDPRMRELLAKVPAIAK